MRTSSAVAALVHVRRRPPPTPAPPDGTGRILTCICHRRYAGPAATAARSFVMRRPPPPACASCGGGHRVNRRPEARAAAAATLVHVCGRPPSLSWCVERAPPHKGVRGGRRHTCTRRLAAAVLVIERRARIDDSIVGSRHTCTRPAAAAADASPARWRRAHLFVRLPPRKGTNGGRRRSFAFLAAATADHARAWRPPPHLYTSACGRRRCLCAPSSQ